MKPGCSMFMKLPYATGIHADYENHKYRVRYIVFTDFDKNTLTKDDMTCDKPKFTINRKLVFPWWCVFMNLINHSRWLIDAWEKTGLRYMIPAIELDLEFIK